MKIVKIGLALILSAVMLLVSTHEGILYLDHSSSMAASFDLDDASEKNEVKDEIELEKLHRNFWPRFLSGHEDNLVSISFHRLEFSFLSEHLPEIPTPPPKA